MKNEFRYRPALNSLGEPTYGVTETMLNIVVPGKKSTIFAAGPDYILEVSHLPKQYSPEQLAEVDVEIDQQGGLRACAAPKRHAPSIQIAYQTKKMPEALRALSTLACAELPKIWDPMPAKTIDGQPLSYVRLVRVLFKTPAARGADNAPRQTAKD